MLRILDLYNSISLDEMKCVRLMNRIDTKYVTTLSTLVQLLELAQAEYRVQMIDGRYNMPYYTLYYDTSRCDMYLEHLHGRKTRQKIRIRTYEASGTSFLEIKNKNNKGRTKKERVLYDVTDETCFSQFVQEHSFYSCSDLLRQVENRFSRITLVNRHLTERLTIDTQLKFHNCQTNKVCFLGDLVVIELKRDGQSFSPILEMLRQLRVHPAGFSKYCMGMALTNESLKQNRFKPRLRMVQKISQFTTNSNCFF